MNPAEIERDVLLKIDQSVLYHATMGREHLDERLEALEREWDLDRWTLAIIGGFSLAGLLIGGLKKGRWALLSGVAGGYVLSRPGPETGPMLFLRNLGIRTRAEIEREKFALKALRGDLDSVREELQDSLSNALSELDGPQESLTSH